MHQRVMAAITDCLKELIDRNNQGDNASHRASNRTISILKRGKYPNSPKSCVSRGCAHSSHRASIW